MKAYFKNGNIQFQVDLALKDEGGGDISSFISNGEWDLIGKCIYAQHLIYTTFLLFISEANIFYIKTRTKKPKYSPQTIFHINLKK